MRLRRAPWQAGGPGSRISVPSHRTRPYELPLAKDKLDDSEGLVSVRFDLWNSDVLSGKELHKEGREPASCDELAGAGI